jgi:hypothetical protein
MQRIRIRIRIGGGNGILHARGRDRKSKLLNDLLGAAEATSYCSGSMFGIVFVNSPTFLNAVIPHYMHS